MMGLFKRKSKTTVNIPATGEKLPFKQIWKRKPLPSAGAENYAFETLGLSPFTPSGPSVSTRQPLTPFAGSDQLYYTQAVPLDGVPTVAGQIISQPLFDPDAGFVGGSQTMGNNPHPAGGR